MGGHDHAGPDGPGEQKDITHLCPCDGDRHGVAGAGEGETDGQFCAHRCMASDQGGTGCGENFLCCIRDFPQCPRLKNRGHARQDQAG